MSWQDEILPIVRNIIGDINPSNYIYTDQQLEQVVVISARYVLSETDLNSYSLNVSESSIDPDPTTSPEDSNFIALTALKTACLILGSEVKTAANTSFIVRDGPSSIDTRANFQSLRELYTSLLDEYGRARVAVQAGNSLAGHAVFGPYGGSPAQRYWGNFS